MSPIECSKCLTNDPDLIENSDHEIVTGCCQAPYNVTCPECGESTSDMGGGMMCEACEEGELPYINDRNEVVVDGAPYYKVGDKRGH